MPGSSLYSRTSLVEQLGKKNIWDILIIGGGATGLGVALDAALRGLSVVLFEQHDFAKGTSSRSTKLIHGGVRYLGQGDIKLVYSALHERDLLVKNAAHVVHPQSFIIPCYSVWDVLKYSAGLRIYDLLAGSFGLGRSKFISRRKISERLPNINRIGLKGGVEYFDGQFDDSRLAINIAQTAIEESAVALNYFKVNELIREGDKISGARVRDVETGLEYEVIAKVVINATGVFVDDILKMDNPKARNTVRPSQGVHVVVNKKFMSSDSAMLIPKTEDGRVLFAVPWHDQLLIGTTDTLMEKNSLEPVALESEINFILGTINSYLVDGPKVNDVKSVFAGLRPLAASDNDSKSTKELSRDHKLFTTRSGMITITGGKWTTYRKMAEETVDLALKNINRGMIKSKTAKKGLHGLRPPTGTSLSVYGTDEELITQLTGDDMSLSEKLVNGYGYTRAQVLWAIRNEMAVTVEDVLARRIRLLFLDADAAIQAAPAVADIFQRETGWSDKRKQEQLDEFYKIAYHYKLNR
jgi:glycerol-3-phosphate dehydrogenase